MRFLKKYIQHLERHDKSRRTIETYSYFITDFAKFLNENSKNILRFTPYDVEEYLDKLNKIKRIKIGKEKYDVMEVDRNDKISTYTENTVKSAVISFIKFMASTGDEYFQQMLRDIKNEMYDIFKIKTRKKVIKTFPRALTKNEVKKVLGVFNDRAEFYSGVVLLFWTGARAGELTEKLYLALNEEVIDGVKCYVDFKNQKFKIETEKRDDKGRFRVLPWCDEIDEEVKTWCNFIKEKKKTWKDEHFRRLLDTIIRQRAKRIEDVIGYRISPKYARYTVETELRKVLPQHYVDYWLGHKYPKELIESEDIILKIHRGVGSPMATVYSDPEMTCEHLRDELIVKRKHYMFEVLYLK